jgi:hypothetical protein
MNCEGDLEQELIAARTRAKLNELENKILIGTLTEHHPDHLIVSGVRIDVTERVSVEQFPIGTKLVSRPRTRSKATRGLPQAFGEVLTEPQALGEAQHHHLTAARDGGKRKAWRCPVRMDHIEGSLRIHRLSHETEPEPWTYEISFAPYAASSIPPACDVVGDDQLERALRYGLGLSEPHLDSSVQKARHDNMVIHHVYLTDELKTLLDDVM